MQIKRTGTVVGSLLLLGVTSVQASLITDPNDPRNWQGATVGTFANLYYGANNATTRQMVVDNQLLDDSYFDASGFTQGNMVRYNGVDLAANPNFGSYGTSFDQPNVNNGFDSSYAYTTGGVGARIGGSSIDQTWVQTNNIIGDSVWDLGFEATKAAVFNTIDHGPLPFEAIESTVYLSNDMVNWTQAVTERVWLEGIYSDTTVLWDGFVYAVGTGTNDTFRYASIIWGGPGALQADGDNEINGIMGLTGDFTGDPTDVPEPASLALLGVGLAGLGFGRKRKSA
jgi:hypothetical protein